MRLHQDYKIYVFWEYVNDPHELDLLRHAIGLILQDKQVIDSESVFDKLPKPVLNEEAPVEGNQTIQHHQ